MVTHKCMICGEYENPEAPGVYDTQWICDDCIEELRLLMGRCPYCMAKGIRKHKINTYYGKKYYCDKCGRKTPTEERDG